MSTNYKPVFVQILISETLHSYVNVFEVTHVEELDGGGCHIHLKNNVKFFCWDDFSVVQDRIYKKLSII